MIFTSVLREYFNDTLHLFYPHLCLGCGNDIFNKDSLICLDCLYALPHTKLAGTVDNPTEKIFKGRIPILSAHSEFFFTKGQVIQQLIHALKYRGNKKAGLFMGQLTGRTLMTSGRFNNIDMLIPLPLFADKEHKRGYNQATVICEGIASEMKIPVITGVVVRERATETQTRKRRTERWTNVKDSFVVNDPARLKGKNILLADDVITTGATLEACAGVIEKAGAASISITALAMASK